MFANPNKNIEALQLFQGGIVADLGAGTGAYSLSASKKVGPTGRIYAVDIQRELLERLKSEANRMHCNNIDIIWGDLEHIGGTKLREHTVDAVILSNILFQITDKKTLIKEIKRILKKNGKVLLIDWNDSYGGLGPIGPSVVSARMAEALFAEQGFKKLEGVSAGAHHYGIIFTYE